MDKIIELKFAEFKKALISFEQILKKPKTVINRDAAIKRFEYTFELFWKISKIILETESLPVYSPKKCFRQLHNLNILTDLETELALSMVNDRNLATHTYNEKLADQLYRRLKKYYMLIQKTSDQMKEYL